MVASAKKQQSRADLTKLSSYGGDRSERNLLGDEFEMRATSSMGMAAASAVKTTTQKKGPQERHRSDQIRPDQIR